MSVIYTILNGAATITYVAQLVDLYALVYAEPPYAEGPEQVAGFAAKLPEEARRPGFELAAAVDQTDLVGIAYGWTMPAGTWWSNADPPPPAEIKAAEKLAVMEWIVHPTRRGEGIGATLMRMLLARRTEQWATLASDPRAAARRIYERAGWRQVSRSTLPWGPPMDLLALPLPAGN